MVGERMSRKLQSLTELNKAYTNEIEKQRKLSNLSEDVTQPRAVKTVTQNKKNNQQRRKEEVELARRVLVIGLMIVALIVCMFVIYRRNSTNKAGQIVPVVLTAEEQEKWESMEVQEGQLYIELNGRIEVNEQKANIRLVNPIYSAYAIRIQVWEKKDENNLLYESEKLMPGTILETVKFSRELAAGEHEGVVNYIIYDDAGDEKSSYPINVRLIRKNIQ